MRGIVRIGDARSPRLASSDKAEKCTSSPAWYPATQSLAGLECGGRGVANAGYNGRPSTAGYSIFATRTAVTLVSGIFATGSRAGLVISLVGLS